MPVLSDDELRARGYSEADIAYLKKWQAQRVQANQGQPPQKQQPPERARDTKTPWDFLMALLRGKGM